MTEMAGASNFEPTTTPPPWEALSMKHVIPLEWGRVAVTSAAHAAYGLDVQSLPESYMPEDAADQEREKPCIDIIFAAASEFIEKPAVALPLDLLGPREVYIAPTYSQAGVRAYIGMSHTKHDILTDIQQAGMTVAKKEIEQVMTGKMIDLAGLTLPDFVRDWHSINNRHRAMEQRTEARYVMTRVVGAGTLLTMGGAAILSTLELPPALAPIKPLVPAVLGILTSMKTYAACMRATKALPEVFSIAMAHNKTSTIMGDLLRLYTPPK